MGRMAAQSFYLSNRPGSHRPREREDKDLMRAWESLIMGLSLFSSQLQRGPVTSMWLCLLSLAMCATYSQGLLLSPSRPRLPGNRDGRWNQRMAWMQRRQEANASWSARHTPAAEPTFTEMNMLGKKTFSSQRPTNSRILSLSTLRFNATHVGLPDSSQTASISSRC